MWIGFIAQTRIVLRHKKEGVTENIYYCINIHNPLLSKKNLLRMQSPFNANGSVKEKFVPTRRLTHPY